ncbi:MAG: sugar ABC transporter permease [Candidatus Epulonipiscium fishelsonii]|nr:MAG: sugar ABC transporter permease [Epulopiscium sp. AS2M-Bin002]
MKKCIISLISVFLGLVAGAFLMWASGHNPVEGFVYLVQGGTKSISRIGDTIATAGPLILTGLSVAFAFRTGLFNIGASGQMLFGGFCATAVGLTFDMPRPLLLIFMIIAGAIGGGIIAFIPGLLKAQFNVHEVVSTIMMNWIAYWVVYYIIPDYFKGTMETESAKLPATATLKSASFSKMFDGSYINLGILISIISVLVIWFILDKTTFGYELKAVGFSRFAAEYAGISVNKSIISSMVISGALAGLAGVIHYTGNASSIQIGVLPSQGMDGIAVALLGATTPIGVLFAALFFALLHAGRGFMGAMTEIPPEIADTIIATIIYFAATSVLIERIIDNAKRRKSAKLEMKEEK